MSADGELYIGDECRGTFSDELDKVFGKDRWRFKVSDYSDCWDMRIFPKVAEVTILDEETNVKIGTAEITSKFEVDGDEMYGRTVMAVPDSIEIKKEKEEVSLNDAIQKGDKEKIKEIEEKAEKGEVVRLV